MSQIPILRFTHKYSNYADPIDKVMDLYDPLDYEFYTDKLCDCRTVINNVVTIVYPGNRLPKEVSYPVILHAPKCLRALKTNRLINNSPLFEDGLITAIAVTCAYIMGYLSAKLIR